MLPNKHEIRRPEDHDGDCQLGRALRGQSTHCPLEDIPKESVNLMSWIVLADSVCRKAFKHAKCQVHSCNPFRYFAGVAEKLALRIAQQKLQESQRSCVSNSNQDGTSRVDWFPRLKDQGERILRTLNSRLVWQKRQFMMLCKRKELAFLLEDWRGTVCRA